MDYKKLQKALKKEAKKDSNNPFNRIRYFKASPYMMLCVNPHSIYFIPEDEVDYEILENNGEDFPLLKEYTWVVSECGKEDIEQAKILGKIDNDGERFLLKSESVYDCISSNVFKNVNSCQPHIIVRWHDLKDCHKNFVLFKENSNPIKFCTSTRVGFDYLTKAIKETEKFLAEKNNLVFNKLF